MSPSVSIRRGFVDLADGQVHFRTAGTGNARPLVVLHPSPGSGLMMAPFIGAMGELRRCIAIDTRGNGDSDPLPEGSEIADFAESLWRTLDALDIAECDLLGSHTGASIAVEASLQQPGRVAHLVIDNLGLWSPDRQKQQIAHNSPAVEPDQIGTQFHWAFNYCRDQQLFAPWYRREAAARRNIDLPDAAFLHDLTVEVLKALRTYHISYSAAARYPKRERLPMVSVPTLVTTCPSDPLNVYAPDVAALVPGARQLMVGNLETAEGAAASAGPIHEYLG